MNTRWILTGQTALVTGGTKGIGRAVAEELLGLGARVGIVARNPEDVSTSLSAWNAGGYEAHGLSADVATPEGREAVADFVSDTLGGAQILVNNVGTNIRKPSLDYSSHETELLWNTNVVSAWELCRSLHPFLAQSGGSIVNIGSVAGSTMVGSGAPYAMTKAALDQLTRYLAVEWASMGIRVNCVNPWYTETPLAGAVLANPEFRARVVSRTPNGQIADPQDVSALVAFLCLPAARHITGQTMAVDGGFLALGL